MIKLDPRAFAVGFLFDLERRDVVRGQRDIAAGRAGGLGSAIGGL